MDMPGDVGQAGKEGGKAQVDVTVHTRTSAPRDMTL